MITIPANLHIGENVEYQPIMDENGVISLLPVKGNIFAQSLDYDLRQAMEEEQLDDNGNLVGKEDVWHG